MSFTEKTLQTLEFDKIREMLAACASTEGAKARAMMLTPSDDAVTVMKRQRYTSDARRLLERKGHPSFGLIRDVADACERADKGATLSMRELLDVANVLRTARGLLDYIHVNTDFDTALDEIFERLIAVRPLEDVITRSIFAEDTMADEASPALAEIRRKKRAAHNHIKDTLQKYVSGNATKYLQENIVTTRDGRYVVPVKVEHKNDVSGLVHDTSSSGATVFIEPMAVVEANNELRLLEAKEAHEIERILAELSAKVSDHSGEIVLNLHNIVELSFWFACGELSVQMRGVSPTLTDNHSIRLMQARHPLIPRDRVVPIDVHIGDDFDTMIITGPNTGGKTVTLKTLGLFLLMAQAGLHIPAAPSSSLGVFRHVLVDLGDEQSIEQSLSTFSSHMVKIVEIMKEVDDASLVLFDELGVGTDPVEGAALAVSIIESVRAAGAVCAATTHYAELKAFALETPGVSNASCEFNVETLKPTYKLIIGAPGKSNAFAISEKLGLPAAIVERAGELLSSDNRRFEDVIQKLDAERLEMEKNRDAMIEQRESYERFKAEAEKEIKERLAAAEKETEKARRQALAMVQSAKASSDYILAEMDKVRKARESADLGDTIRQTRANVKKMIRENEDKFDPVEEKEEGPYVLPRPLRIGDEVYLVTLHKKGIVAELPDKNGNLVVQTGILNTRTKLENVRLEESKPLFTDSEKKTKPAASYTVSVSSSFSPEIDLRGKNGEEAWLMVDKYLDEAVLHNVKSVQLIHGKGTGALRNALWQFMRGDKRIAGYRIGQYGEGDGGVTVVELK